MKTKVVYSIILFIFCFSASFAQEQTIKLNLEEGYEYVFDLTEKNYVQKPTGENNNTRVKKKKLKIIIEKADPGISIKLRVNIVENYKENTYGLVRQRTDYIYRDFRDIRYFSGIDPQTFFSSNDLIFQINLTNRKIELLNRAELLENYYELLSENKSENIEKAIDIFNKSHLKDITGLVDFLLWFHNAHITVEGIITNSILDDHLILKEKARKQFNLSNSKQSNILPRMPYKYFSINIDNGLLQIYRFFQKDSIKNKFGETVGEYLFTVSEQNYKLLSSRRKTENPVVITGKIKNPLSDILYFRYLNEPFGLTIESQPVYLNQDGSFQTEINLKHAGFIFIENQNPNRYKSSKNYVMYADRGDTIILYDDINFPEKIELGGTRIAENILLDKIKSKCEIFDSGEYFDRWFNIYYGSRKFTEVFQNDIKVSYKFFMDLLSEFELANSQLEDSKEELSDLSFQFIKNEIKSYYYGLIFQYLSIASAYKKDKQIISHISESIQAELDFNNLNSYYNDYGFYSRYCVNKYVRYKFASESQINNPGYAFRGSTIDDLNQHIQFSRMMLTGSLLYREIATSLEQSFSQYIYLPWQDYKGYILNEAIDYLKLITTNCYDAEIVDKVQRILDQYQQLQNKNPEIKELAIYDTENQKYKLKDVLNSNSAIVLFISNYRFWRPSLEKIFEDNPTLNFVRVVQFNNQKEYNDYHKLAEPQIPTFLYLNDSVPLDDIFLNSNVFAIFNKQGELIHYTNDINPAIKFAKQSLNEKKEFDKSQLQTIIIILAIILFTLILALLFWKWRVRQRFRKEEQLRRLRELELTAIRSQMNPHFLFNCLNSVQNLVQQNKGREAHLYLSDFAGLIRKVLQNSEKEEVSLAEELEMTRQYLNLEKLRFDFEYAVSVQDEIDTNNTMVPSMLLQPFAENAVVHGLQNKQGDRRLIIEVVKKDEKDGILITIEDNGIGRKAAVEISKQKNGKGSKLMKERLSILQQKQGEKYHLEIIDLKGDETGTRVEIHVPEEI